MPEQNNANDVEKSADGRWLEGQIAKNTQNSNPYLIQGFATLMDGDPANIKPNDVVLYTRLGWGDQTQTLARRQETFSQFFIAAQDNDPDAGDDDDPVKLVFRAKGAKPIDVAAQLVGRIIEESGTNSDPAILEITGGGAVSWCALFVWFTFARSVGVPKPVGKYILDYLNPNYPKKIINPLGSVENSAKACQARGWYIPAAKGMKLPVIEDGFTVIAFMGSRKDSDPPTSTNSAFQHIGLVESIDHAANVINTIEGNTNADLSDDKQRRQGVWRKHHAMNGYIVGFAKIPHSALVPA